MHIARPSRVPSRNLTASRRSRGVFVAAVLLLFLLLPTRVSAQRSLSLQTHTVIDTAGGAPTLQTADRRTMVRLIQFIDASSEDVGVEGLSIELSGRLVGQLASAPLSDGLEARERFDGDVLVGLLRWRDRRRRISLALGRQYLFFGAGRVEHLDGLSVLYRTPWNIDVSVFGGLTRPWQLDVDVDEPGPDGDPFVFYNWAVGGRLRWRVLDHGYVAAGFLHEGHSDETVRQLLTAQAGYIGWGVVDAAAGATIDLIDKLPQEIWVNVGAALLPRLRVSGDFSYQVPSATIPKTSIFSVFSSDAYHSISGSVLYGFGRHVRAGVDGAARVYVGDGEAEARVGYDVGASVTVMPTSRASNMIALRVQLVDAGDQWSINNRLYSRWRLPFGLHVHADVWLLVLGGQREGAEATDFERRAADHPLSVGGRLLASYRFTRSLSAHVGGSLFVSPLAKHDLRVLSGLTYSKRWGWGI
ncbi:MAG: hypothetical protein KC503_05445 [Myxococcales bacterium]|nr:hypothetical protein [Myxococcales bacterium]